MSRARDIANYGDGIDTSSITSGTFADARIPNLATSKITSGTFADARIASSNVTQHEGSIDALASNPTVTLGSNTTFGSGVSLTNATFPAGMVVQRNHAKYVSTQGLNVISEPNSTSGVTTSNYIDSGLTTSITPKKTGNKILVICSFIYGLNANVTALGLIRRTGPSVANSANIGTGGDARKASMVLYPFSTHSSSARFSASIVWEDEAQDETTSHVYTLCGSHNGTGTAFYLNGTNTSYTGQSTITVLEVMV